MTKICFQAFTVHLWLFLSTVLFTWGCNCKTTQTVVQLKCSRYTNLLLFSVEVCIRYSCTTPPHHRYAILKEFYFRNRKLDSEAKTNTILGLVCLKPHIHKVYVNLPLLRSMVSNNLQASQTKQNQCCFCYHPAVKLPLHNSSTFTSTIPTTGFPSFSGPLLHKQKLS